jgi:hypothetical protein
LLDLRLHIVRHDSRKVVGRSLRPHAHLVDNLRVDQVIGDYLAELREMPAVPKCGVRWCTILLASLRNC